MAWYWAKAELGRFADNVNYRLWNLAERMDFDNRRPRWFWAWLLKYQDRRHGYKDLEY